MNSSVFSGVGQDIHNLDNKKADKHELFTLSSRVDSLERVCRELRSDIDGLRNELQTSQETLRIINEILKQKGML